MPNDSLTSLELKILRGLSRGESVELIARLTETRPVTIGMELARLQVKGYITEDGKLSSKGVASVQGMTT
ncbi:MAG TPA: hypothetical protein VEJ36_03640 [Nitrososphaerales archaeon]|nr:hypothetical protein [Nitrososphaerales archaeon]